MAEKPNIWSLLHEPDILCTVLLHLSPRDLRAAQLVCRARSQEVQDSGIWRRNLAAW